MLYKQQGLHKKKKKITNLTISAQHFEFEFISEWAQKQMQKTFMTFPSIQSIKFSKEISVYLYQYHKVKWHFSIESQILNNKW